MDPAVCFTSQESLFDAERLAGGFGGGFRSAAGCTEQNTQILTLGWHTVKIGRCVQGAKSCIPHHVVFFDLSTDQVLTCYSSIL